MKNVLVVRLKPTLVRGTLAPMKWHDLSEKVLIIQPPLEVGVTRCDHGPFESPATGSPQRHRRNSHHKGPLLLEGPVAWDHLKKCPLFKQTQNLLPGTPSRRELGARHCDFTGLSG